MTSQIPTAVKQWLPSVIRFLEDMQHQKCVTFSSEKCELLLINRKECDSLSLNSYKIRSVQGARYLGDLLNEK